MDDVERYLPQRINEGGFLTAYTLNELHERIADARIVLPICSLGTPTARLAELGSLVLPPLYHEALDDSLKTDLIERIRWCFPYMRGTPRRDAWRGTLQVVELPAEGPSAIRSVSDRTHRSPDILAFSVDTAVEEHGPHLPLATDTIQSYGVLRQLSEEVNSFVAGPPVEYGHLTWGLPFGLSIDITPPLLTEYVARFARAAWRHYSPRALYVVDVHGSIVHRNAIEQGLQQSGCPRYRFRWLHERLVPVAGQRGDQHAGGVETAVVEYLSERLIDARWWPARRKELARAQMTLERAVELSTQLAEFERFANASQANGIVGDIDNYDRLDGRRLFDEMLRVARQDVNELVENMDNG